MPHDDAGNRLREQLAQRTASSPDFWSFAESRSRKGNHALFQYPAMMVPELQGALLDDLLVVLPDVQLVYDPFAGSGTVLLESLYRGLDFHGDDVNPLAILLCQVKASPPTVFDAQSSVAEVMGRVKESQYASIPAFPGIDKWFKPEIQAGLARIRQEICRISCIHQRRFLWICLAETIRLVSNSRMSTFKLHTYSQDDICRRETDAIKVFCLVANQNIERLTLHWNTVDKLDSSKPRPRLELRTGSVTEPRSTPKLADVLMTSPPYGDNKTTVPYGQHSYLPLQWIPHGDIPGTWDNSYLESTSRIDTLSLGGSLKEADAARAALLDLSSTLGTYLTQIDPHPQLRKKVLAFTRDYAQALNAISGRLRDGAFCFFTLGERRVGKQTFPLVDITRELLVAEGHEYITTIERTLPRKRMASKNSEGATMAKEWILVTRAWKADR